MECFEPISSSLRREICASRCDQPKSKAMRSRLGKLRPSITPTAICLLLGKPFLGPILCRKNPFLNQECFSGLLLHECLPLCQLYSQKEQGPFRNRCTLGVGLDLDSVDEESCKVLRIERTGLFDRRGDFATAWSHK